MVRVANSPLSTERAGTARRIPVSEGHVAGGNQLNQLLRMAVIAGVESAVRVHIDRGDDLDARDANGMTPLMLSAARNKPTICTMLLAAGANCELLDPSGKTALQIATAAGSEATAAILSAASSSVPEIGIAPDSEPESGLLPAASIYSAVASGNLVACEVANSTGVEPAAEFPELTSPSTSSTPIEKHGSDAFDLSNWEVELEATPPKVDLAVLDSVSAIQSAISLHKPIDSSTDWDDMDAYLPERALPLARSGNVEARAALRLLLVRAIREGSVPHSDVAEQSTNEDRSANPLAEAYLTMVINDLGAEVDERFEYANVLESFEVYVDPEETPDEEALVDEALAAIDLAAMPRNEALQVYQREYQHIGLLSAEEEAQLGQAMEMAIDAALDALAEWPDGIALTLAAGKEVIAGRRPLSSICLSNSEPDLESDSPVDEEANTFDADVSDDSPDEDTEVDAEDGVGDRHADFGEALLQLRTIAQGQLTPHSARYEIRQALANLRLNRNFLLELNNAMDGVTPSADFSHAVAAYKCSRDRMASANLKLAFFHANKFRYSGEPLGDLAQEGNIGLLKAVDRYDWRRGFKFSTYATWWIRRQIAHSIADKARTIRLPVHVHEKVQRLKRMAETLEIKSEREPTIFELAKGMEMTQRKVEALMRIEPVPICIDDLPVDEVIDAGGRDDCSLIDPADIVDENKLRHDVRRLIASLSSTDGREQEILRLRFGIGVGEALTLNEIGQLYGVTRERIRQIEEKALKKLRGKFACELLEYGFAYSPGKGYWR
jgi:RNA polymerase primary sigma factor